MANRIRCGVFHGVMGFGLLFAAPLFAQNAAAPGEATPTPPKVVDANGKFVGWPRTIGPGGFTNADVNGVERNVKGVWVVIQATRGGFSGAAIFSGTYLFTSSDCSGIKYLDATSLPTTGVIVTNTPNNELLFPGTPLQLLTIGSYLVSGIACFTYGNPVWVGPVQSFNLNSLGLVPPFTVK